MKEKTPILSEIIQYELQNSPMLRDFIRLGFCNISGLAKFLKPTIEKQLGSNISKTALGMALRRGYLGDPLTKIDKRLFPKHLDITVRTSIYEVTLLNDDKARQIVNKIRQKVKISKGDILTITEGLYAIVIFTSQKYKQQIKKIIGRQRLHSELNNVANITVNWPRITKDIPGIYYRITRALAIRDISIQSFHTVGSEMVLIVKSDVFGRAYQTLHALLTNQLEFTGELQF